LYTDLLRVSALSFILRPFVNLPGSILYREMRFKEQTTVTVAVLLVSNFTSIAMAYSGYGVWSLIAGGLVGSCASALLLAQLTKWRPHFCSDIRRGKDIARYGLLVSTTDILVYLRQQASNFILSRTLGPSSVGLYNKGESLAKMPHRFVTNSVYQVLFRAMAAEQDNLDKCRYLFFRSITLVAVYATPFYVGILWLADPFIRGVYGIKWIDSATPLFILALAWPFWLMENLSGAVLAARNWLHREFLVQIATLALTCLAILIGLSKGINGVACAILGASVFSAFYMYLLAVKCLHARWSGYFIALAPAAILNVILAATLFLIDIALTAGLRSHDFAYMGILGVGGGLVYVLCFLYAPIPTLRSEQMRWRNKLGLKDFPLLGLKN
jgi:O-antigen/teichoic acid export membrane protein